MYLSHQIRHKSKTHKSNSPNCNDLPVRVEVQLSTEYQVGDPIEDGLRKSELSSEQKVQCQLLKDIGLEKVPDTKHVSGQFRRVILREK